MTTGGAMALAFVTFLIGLFGGCWLACLTPIVAQHWEHYRKIRDSKRQIKSALTHLRGVIDKAAEKQ